jgi:hypothetical protein
MARPGRPSKGERRATNVYLPPEKLRAIKIRAFDERRSMTELIESAIDIYLAQARQDEREKAEEGQ